MAGGIAAMGTTFNLPNFVGELFSVSPKETPFLSAIGGLTGGKSTDAIEFPFQKYDLRNPAQPAHLEGAAAPSADSRVRDQVYNVVQIFHEKVSASYTKQAAVGNLSGINISGSNPVQDELTFQTMVALQSIARDVEYTFLNGVYARPTDNATARKTRGILAAISTNVVAAGATALTKTHVKTLLRTMWTNGAPLIDPIFMCNGFQKEAITALYGVEPQSRVIGGLNIEQIVTDYGTFGIMLNRWMPTTAVAVIDLAVCSPVILFIPGKGFLFREALGKAGSSDDFQIYGEIGLEHGPEIFHGKVTGLTDN